MTNQAFGHLLHTINNGKNPQQQTQSKNWSDNQLGYNSFLPSALGKHPLSPHSLVRWSFCNSLSKLPANTVLSLYIFHPCLSLKCLFSEPASTYTGDTIRVFTSWSADRKAAARRRWVSTGHRYSHWGDSGTVLSVNRNAVALLPRALIPCRQDHRFTKGFKNGNIRAWSCSTSL